MAKCAVCGKGVHFGNAVSHSHRRSNKIWKSNLKSVRVKVNGGTKKMYVCTSCCGLPVHHKKRTHSYTRVGECVLFLVTACEEIIAKDKTGNNNQDGKQTVPHEKHDAHTDANPKQNKSD